MAEKKATKKNTNANKNRNNNKRNIIIGACAALVVIIIIVVIVICNNKKIDDSYFVSDGSKYVLTIDYSDVEVLEDEDEETPPTPKKAHEVYTYSGDTITSLKYYYEYADENTAKKALDFFKEEGATDNMAVEGKYVVITANEADYSNTTASEIKEAIEFYQESMNDNSDNGEEVEEETEEE